MDSPMREMAALSGLMLKLFIVWLISCRKETCQPSRPRSPFSGGGGLTVEGSSARSILAVFVVWRIKEVVTTSLYRYYWLLYKFW